MDVFKAILQRVEEKRENYATYGFEKLEMASLNTFFDLAQEYDGLENLYLVGVTVPRVYFGLHCNLYVVPPKSDTIKWVASSHPDPNPSEKEVPDYIEIADAPYRHGHAYVVPIHGKKTAASHILLHGSRDVIGIFEVLQGDQLTEGQLFFIQKYANRIGFNLYNKFLAEQNIQHLKFINNLVADIEHNVIIPNIHYRYYFRKIRDYLNIYKEIEGELDSLLEALKSHDKSLYAKISETMERMIVTNRAMFNDQETIERHYRHVSLFLESLFRPDHFLFGEYILKKTPCYLWQDIVLPQLERYRDRFTQKGVDVNRIIKDHKASADVEVRVDKGLMAQVIANLFSNAAKYTESVVDTSGKKVKRVQCKTTLVENFFGRGHHGVRFNVFTSGPPIDLENVANIFDEGFRLAKSEAVAGKGHGLYFVKNVVEVHGGVVGYNADKLGNDFYFFVPA
jgi:signal transduction histidine kinase